MSTRWAPVMLMILLLLFFRGAAVQGQTGGHAAVEPQVLAALEAAPDGYAGFWVVLRDKADLGAAYHISDKLIRRQFVYQTLWDVAQISQTDLRAFLAEAQAQDPAIHFEPYYMVNAIFVTADRTTMEKLAIRRDVAVIRANHTYPRPPTPQGGASVLGVGLAWGVGKIRADQVWAQGIDGAGVVVANIDTGVYWTHEALKRKYRGWDGSSANHNYNWFDPVTHSPQPTDWPGSHGTHTMGTMIGSDPAGRNRIGVAPGARWIAARGCGERTCMENHLLAAAQWMLAPYPIGRDPSQGDPSKAPDVVNNSWGGEPADTFYQAVLRAWRAAGIFPVFAAGNSGPSSGTIQSPGDNPEAVAVGATDRLDNIAVFSSRGPSRLTAEIKPDVSAPGVDVCSSTGRVGYVCAGWTGTSMAAPHVSGVVALLLQTNQELTMDQIEEVLESTALDRGMDGPDRDYGHGRADAWEAYQRAVIQPTPTPTPTGTATPTPTVTSTASTTATPTGTATASTIPTHTATLTSMPTTTPTQTATPAATPTLQKVFIPLTPKD